MHCRYYKVFMGDSIATPGFAVLLPKNECQLGRGRRTTKAPPDIQAHLQLILHLLCQGDTLHMVSISEMYIFL